MSTVLAGGVAVIDFVFGLNEVPEPGRKYRSREAEIIGGGCAANAAVAVARLGGHALLAARLGDDMIGDMVLDGLGEEGVDCQLVQRYPGKRTSYSAVVVDGDGERTIIGFRDETMDFGADWLSGRTLPLFDAVLADTRWPEGAKALMECARERGVPGVLDGEAPASEAQDALHIASHLAFSVQGLAEYCGTDNLDDGLKSVAAKTGAWVCVTEGENGVRWLEDDAVQHMPAFAVDAVDTLGAGDVWHGAFAFKLGSGAAEVDAIRYANAVSAIKCTQFGGRAGTPTAAAVDQFLKENPS